MSDASEDVYWGKELAAFSSFADATPGHTYRDWQPTKWQSLQRICDELVALVGPHGTALELGCGSATLLSQLALAGWRCRGLDVSAAALELASRAARSVGVAPERFQLVTADFDEWSGPKADVVLSIGVIEHFDVEGQLRVLDLHCRHARRAVLVGVPNLDSPVFRSFIEWARRNDRLYEEEHHPISVRGLAEALGRAVLVEGGCHLFLSRAEYYVGGDPELEDFYGMLRDRLVAVGGARFSAFPRLDLTAADIGALSHVEAETSPAQRLRFGFLHYFMLDASE